MMEEVWKIIPEFPSYQISNYGNVYNTRRYQSMATSQTQFDHVKITLRSDEDGERYTRSVAQLVAEAFVEPPDYLCDSVVLLDGDLSNVAAENLTWRPTWYAWKYSRQLKAQHPLHYQNLPVANKRTGAQYNSIIEAGMTEGLLFEDIWRSTYTSAILFPNSDIFEILK